MVFAVEELRLADQLLQQSYFKKVVDADDTAAPSQNGTLRLVESHGDQVRWAQALMWHRLIAKPLSHVALLYTPVHMRGWHCRVWQV